ncbi:MAG: hypothetical protein KDC53_10550 [Saprospiraceae bacterium]|nr:hypothetical protein [Saprospiraceae bacterium]
MLIILHTNLAEAQNICDISYQSTHTGRNVSVHYGYTLGRHNILLGLKYHINRTPIDNQNHVFYKRFRAMNFKEHIGLDLNYQFLFRNKSVSWRPLIFYNFQCTNTPIQRYGYTWRLLPGGGQRGLVKTENISQPIRAIEHYIGLGFSYAISEQIKLIEKAGVGINFYKNLDKEFFPLKTSAWEISKMLSVGISYSW